MAMKVGGDDRDARDEAQRFQAVLVHRIVVGFRVKTAERGHRRADGVHGRRVLGKFLDDFDDAFGQFAFGGEQTFQFVQFLAVGQMIVMQQVNYFLERNVAGEFIDVVTAVDQLTNIASDVAQAGGGGDDAFQTFGGSSWGGHVCCNDVLQYVRSIFNFNF